SPCLRCESAFSYPGTSWPVSSSRKCHCFYFPNVINPVMQARQALQSKADTESAKSRGVVSEQPNHRVREKSPRRDHSPLPIPINGDLPRPPREWKIKLFHPDRLTAQQFRQNLLQARHEIPFTHSFAHHNQIALMK